MTNSTSTTSNNPSNNPNNRLSTILGSSLEVLIHELLYLRSLYPRDAFESTRYLGVSCHACRHPDVADYIYETLVVSVPAICTGVADELHLVFYDTEETNGGGVGGGEGTDMDVDVDMVEEKRNSGRVIDENNVLERFVVAFDVSSVVEATRILRSEEAGTRGEETTSSTATTATTIVQEIALDLQRSLRDVLLKLISFQGTESSIGRRKGRTNFTGTTTFKLCLHCRQNTLITSPSSSPPTTTIEKNATNDGVTNRTNAEDLLQSCPELNTAMQEGKWFRSDMSSSPFGRVDGDDRSSCGVTRPIKSVYVPSCGFRMQLLMEV